MGTPGRVFSRGVSTREVSSSALESDEVLGVRLRVLEDDEYSRIGEVVDDRVVAELGAAGSLRRLLHVAAADRVLAGQHATLEHVLGAVGGRRRVLLPRRIVEVDREVDALAVVRR